MKGMGELKELFRDDRSHIEIGVIKSLHLAEDRSYLKVQVNIFPENRIIVATMTWDMVGPDAGLFTFPSPDDLVLICFAEGSDDQAFILKRLASKVDTIPEQALTGDTVLAALSGKKTWINSDTKINLAKGATDPTENVILGQEWKTFMITLMTKLITTLDTLKNETHIGNLGYDTSIPKQTSIYDGLKSDLETLKASPVEDEKVLSDLTFTEK